MKKVLLMVFLILIVSVVVIVSILIKDNALIETATSDNNIIVSSYENIDSSKIFLNSTATADMATDFSNTELIGNQAEVIIIGTIKSIDGGINYNPKTKEYTMNQTIGTIQVDKVLKGTLKENEISFIKAGGMVTVSEYEKSLTKEQVEYQKIDKLTQEEKDSKYVSQFLSGDIDIEENKTYLIYMNYYEDYDRYFIGYMEYGLREISKDTIESDYKAIDPSDYSSIKVKNNATGEYETLDTILPEKLNT